ncbi:MAG TPA: glycosyltransferase [Chloroflexi bacterium]|nr:glycosyltransferase [Chloroflexota bacterium]
MSSPLTRNSLTPNPLPPQPLTLQQRVLPAYRAPFFEILAQAAGGLRLFAGQPLPVESIVSAEEGALPHVRVTWGRNRHFRDPSSRAFLCWQSGLLAWLERVQPRALVVEANPRYLSNWLAVRWMRRRGLPVLGWGLGAPRSGNPLERTFRLAYLRSLDGVIAYSRRGAEQYRALGLERVFVAHNAAVSRPAAPPPERPWPPRRPLTVLFVGRLQARKRLDLLFRACAALPQELRPRLLVVGDGPARAQFEAAAAAHYPQTIFLGALHGEALRPHLAAADLFVLPGTGGLAVQQAMSAALPIIVAQGDGTQDDLVRPENGWQVPPGSLPALTETLRQALSDPARLRRMGEASFRIVRDEINLERMAQAFLEAVDGGR